MDKTQLQDRVRQILDLSPDFTFIHTRYEELLKVVPSGSRELAETMLMQLLFDYLV